MKKYIYGLFFALISVAMFTACSADEGTDEGNDGSARVTLYNYTAEQPYDADCDAYIRVVANSATTEAYALAEKVSEKEANIAKMGESGYADYVVSNGKKLENIKGASVQEEVFQNLPAGENAITVVAVGKGGKFASSVIFNSITWSDVIKGTYTFSVANIQKAYAANTETTLQVCDSDPNTYRFKNLFGAGKHLLLTAVGKGTDENGNYIMFKVPSQATSLTFGSYGEISVRDVAEWQNDESYLDCKIYEDHNAALWVQYFVSAGNLGYGYDEFTPEN